jgi:hypothetical protein
MALVPGSKEKGLPISSLQNAYLGMHYCLSGIDVNISGSFAIVDNVSFLTSLLSSL